MISLPYFFLEFCVRYICFLNSTHTHTYTHRHTHHPPISIVLFLPSYHGGNRFTVLQCANRPPRKFQQSLASAMVDPTKKESRMLNRAFYTDTTNFHYFAARHCLIDLPSYERTFHESPVRDESVARSREMLIAISTRLLHIGDALC